MAAPETGCSRCEKPLDTTGYPLWCKACQREYRREYRSLQKQMAETRGFAAGTSAGAAAMKDQAVRWFRQFPHAAFSGAEIAVKIQQMPTPLIPVGD